jgi:competence protein ComEC
LLLWSYALLTGLSPSVIRAAGMCSIHGVARLARRKTSLLHLLSLSAMIMVITRPPVIFEAGFQLSFAAVAGIALFYPRLKGLVHFSLWLPQWCWKMTALSLSAQAGTFPLVIYHFREYPCYSLLSNLPVIPLTVLILYSGALFFSLSWIPGISGLLSVVLHYLCRILNVITGFTSRLPWSVTGELSITPGQVLVLYCMILLTALYAEYRRVRTLMALILSVIMMLAISGCLKYRELTGPVSQSLPGRSLQETVDQSYTSGQKGTCCIETF